MLATVLRESLLKQLDNSVFEPKKLKRDKVKKYYYRFEGTCKRMQGVNVPKVARILLIIFNSSDNFKKS